MTKTPRREGDPLIAPALMSATDYFYKKQHLSKAALQFDDNYL